MLVRSVVAGDRVHIKMLRRLGINSKQEVAPLLVAMSLHSLADHPAGGEVEGGESVEAGDEFHLPLNDNAITDLVQNGVAVAYRHVDNHAAQQVSQCLPGPRFSSPGECGQEKRVHQVAASRDRRRIGETRTMSRRCGGTLVFGGNSLLLSSVGTTPMSWRTKSQVSMVPGTASRGQCDATELRVIFCPSRVVALSRLIVEGP